MTAGQIIRVARLKAGLTQAELAERLGRERAQVARWETGGQEPSFANVRSVVEACGFVLNVQIAQREETATLDWLTASNSASILGLSAVHASSAGRASISANSRAENPVVARCTAVGASARRFRTSLSTASGGGLRRSISNGRRTSNSTRGSCS